MLHPASTDVISDAPDSLTVQLDTEGENVLHFAALPDGTSSLGPVEFPSSPILSFDFELDTFQRCAIACVDRGESVLVSAHTSAGKTAVAQYAIALSLSRHSRVVYTSPIKALSNQKYQDLESQFGDVGLLTGDVTINPSASCLVMTTEVLRMMLLAGDSLIRELSWVIFDEVHYMRDRSRGVVWEESIILLPPSARFVFLSATIPNAREFSEWISSLHHQICHVVYTEHRPVPLRYYISPLGDPKLYLVRNADGDIVDTTFAVACQSLGAGRLSKKALGAHTCSVVVQLIKDGLSPMIVFVFSRRDCDRLHEHFSGHSFVAPEEKALIKQIFRNAGGKLDASDRCLPQVEATLRLAERGIGVHHGGLLPLMKEVTEVMFGQGLLKVLFATETFAMGLNMPAKTVVFHELFKFDGSDRRLITSGEFIQMSGRAGRRNQDRFGIVALTYAGDVSPPDLRAMMTEAAQPLNSEFRVTYNMLLNLVLASHIQPRELMRRSFHQFQMLRQLPLLVRRRQANVDAAAAIVIENEELAQAAVDLDDEITRIECRMREIAFDERNIGQILVPGRVVRDCDFGWGVVAARRRSGIDLLAASELKCEKVKRELGNIVSIGRASLAISFESLSSDLMRKILQTIRSLEQKGITPLQPAEYVTFRRDELASGQMELDRLRRRTTTVDAGSAAKYKQKRSHLMEVEAMERRIAEMQHLVDQKDLEAMVAVLNKLGFLEGGVISTKGRIAATITAGDELVVTQLMFSGVVEKLSPQDCAALFSAFVSEEQVTKQAAAIPNTIEAAWAQLLTIARNVATIAADCGCDIDVEKFQRSFCPVFVGLTKDWAGGASFAKLMEANHGFYEGSIVRTMKRLDELLNQAANAAGLAGIGQLKQTFADAAKAIERGIIFTASLYL